MHCILKLEEFASTLRKESTNQLYASTIIESFAEGLFSLLQVTATNSGMSPMESLSLITNQKQQFKMYCSSSSNNTNAAPSPLKLPEERASSVIYDDYLSKMAVLYIEEYSLITINIFYNSFFIFFFFLFVNIIFFIWVMPLFYIFVFCG